MNARVVRSFTARASSSGTPPSRSSRRRARHAPEASRATASRVAPPARAASSMARQACTGPWPWTVHPCTAWRMRAERTATAFSSGVTSLGSTSVPRPEHGPLAVDRREEVAAPRGRLVAVALRVLQAEVLDGHDLLRGGVALAHEAHVHRGQHQAAPLRLEAEDDRVERILHDPLVELRLAGDVVERLLHLAVAGDQLVGHVAEVRDAERGHQVVLA